MASAGVSPAAAIAAADFSSDVVVGLSNAGQKELPSKYLYDEVGSALFDVICLLPEYGLSRAGMRLLQRDAHEIVSLLPTPVLVAELGSGSGQKTRLLLQALSKRQRVNYYPIDISGSALSRCQQEIGQMQSIESTTQLNTTLNALSLGQGLTSASLLINQDILGLDDNGNSVNGTVSGVIMSNGTPSLVVGNSTVQLSNVQQVL